MGGGTVAQSIMEQEMPVSAPAKWPRAANLRYPVAATPISSDPVKGWSAERESEEAILAKTARTT